MKAEHLRPGDVISLPSSYHHSLRREDFQGSKLILDVPGWQLVSRVPASSINRLEDLRQGDLISHSNGINAQYTVEGDVRIWSGVAWKCTRRVDEIEEPHGVWIRGVKVPLPPVPIHVEPILYDERYEKPHCTALDEASDRGIAFIKRTTREWPYGMVLYIAQGEAPNTVAFFWVPK